MSYNELRAKVASKDKIIQMLEHLLFQHVQLVTQAQTALTDLLKRNRELEKRLEDMEAHP